MSEFEKGDESGGRFSWPFVAAEWILAGPQGHSEPLWIRAGHEAAPHRFDFIGMTFRACRISQSPHVHCGHATPPDEVRYNGSASHEAEPSAPPDSVMVLPADAGGRRACAVFPMIVSDCSLRGTSAMPTRKTPSRS